MPRDLRQALRGWLRTPGLFALNVLVLAAGIGGAVALYGLVHGVLLKPLPFPAAEGLHTVWFRAPGIEIEQFEQSPGTFLHFAKGSSSFEQFGIYESAEVALTGEHLPRRLLAVRATPSVLHALRTAPPLGRLFAEREGVPGSPPTVVLSHRLWRDQYGARPSLLGEAVRIDGVEREVIGILPQKFAFPNPEVDLWLPLVIDRNALEITNFSYRGLARLAVGVDASEAERELTVLNAGLSEAYPDDLSAKFLRDSRMQPYLEELRAEIVGSAGTMLWTALAAVAVVLLIAAANVLNLLLVRSDARSSELALRTALGASRLRLLRRALSDGIVLGMPAGALGGLLALIALQRVRRLEGFDLPRLHELAAGPGIVFSSLLLGSALGATLGVVSSWRIAGAQRDNEALRGTRSSTASRSSWGARRAFVVVQVAASTALLLAASLLVRSFGQLIRVDPGFDPERLVTLFVTLPEADYPSAERSRTFWRAAVDRLAAQPGVASAAAVSKLPFDVGGQTGTLIEEHPNPDGLAYVFGHRTASPAFFATAGIPLLAGRTFHSADEELGSEGNVVVVSETLAERYWQEAQAALGKRLRPAGSSADGRDLPWATIVGVVGDLRNAGLRELSSPTIYFPHTLDQGRHLRSQFLLLRLAPGVRFDLGTARQALQQVDPNVPLARYRTGEELVAGETARLRITLVLLALAGGVATVIGGFGLFAMLLTFVGMRRREIGVRLAVGATQTDVRWLVTRAALGLVGSGALLGILLSLITSRSLGAFLYGVGAADPWSVAAVLAVLLIVAVLASLPPAARAARVDPAAELRAE